MTIDNSEVTDWVTDWDHHDPTWVADPYPIWNELREQCPMARTGRYNEGVWLPLTYDQLHQISHDTETFSNVHYGFTAGGSQPRALMPPIHSDPPEHGELRRILLPFFSPRRIEAWEPDIEAHCRGRARSVAERGAGDAAVDYAQHIPVAAIAAILGVAPELGDTFRRWVVQFIEIGGRDLAVREEAERSIMDYMAGQIEHRRANPGTDLVTHLTQATLDGRPLDDDLIQRMLLLQLVAGIDTTWSSIGAALWHLATHPEDRRRLAADPALIPTASEELLRAYAPVNVARRVTRDTTIDGLDIRAGETVMMSFPIACRDPQQFDDADEVVIDRTQNRHMAFGSGIHRCLGSNLARLEMEVAIRVWLEELPDFELAPGADVIWSEGQIRGPRSIPVVVP